MNDLTQMIEQALFAALVDAQAYGLKALRDASRYPQSERQKQAAAKILAKAYASRKARRLAEDIATEIKSRIGERNAIDGNIAGDSKAGRGKPRRPRSNTKKPRPRLDFSGDNIDCDKRR